MAQWPCFMMNAQGHNVRDYYIQNLCSTIVVRPPHPRLLIVSVDDPRGGRLSSMIRNQNIILSRAVVGGALVGCPRRFEEDIWYLSTLPLLDLPGREITAQVETNRLHTNSILAPHRRAMGLLNLTTMKKQNIKTFVQTELEAYEEKKSLLDPGLTTIQKIAKVKESKLIAGSEEDILSVLWIKEKMEGFMRVTILYHKEGNTYHVNCNCSVEKKKYRPIDKLLAVYLVYVYKS